MKIIQEFTDDHNKIILQYTEDGLFVNLSELGKSFNRNPDDFLDLPIANELFNTVKEDYTLPTSVLKPQKKDNISIIWANQDFSVQFAYWLNPALEICLRKCIKDFLATPVVHINTTNRLVWQTNEDLYQLIIESNYDRSVLRVSNPSLVASLTQSAFENQFKAEPGKYMSQMETDTVAKSLGIDATTMMDILKRKGIIYDCGGTWLLDKLFQNKNYSFTESDIIKNEFGELLAGIRTNWTMDGAKFVIDLLRSDKEVTLLRLQIGKGNKEVV